MADRVDILFVDEDDESRARLAADLGGGVWRLFFASDVDQALRVLFENRISVLVYDTSAARSGNTDILQVVSRHFKDTLVILVSDQPSLEAAVESVRLGARDYVTKPYTSKRISDSIRKVLVQKQERPAVTVMMPGLSHRKIANYRVIRTLGTGSMGAVFLAASQDGADERLYAVKTMTEHKFMDEEASRDLLERFVREAETAQRLNSPHVIRVFDYGIDEQDMLPYLVMEYFEGEPLKRWISQGVDKLSVKQRVHIIRQIADALSAVHGLGVWHRDVKPSNVLISQELLVKLADFGIVRTPGSDLTKYASIVGSAAYASPEALIAGGKPDYRADIFSLGVLSYELMLGYRPFTGSSIPALMRSISRDKPPLPSEEHLDFPIKLEMTLLKMLEKDPSRRYQEAAHVARDLEWALA